MHDEKIRRLIESARKGGKEAMGELFAEYQNYLQAFARERIDRRLSAKGGVSDLIQETFIDAQRGITKFDGRTSGEVLAWLRTIMNNKAINFGRTYRDTEKRDVTRECSMEEVGSKLGVRDFLSAKTKTPSKHISAREQEELIEQAIQRLSEKDRQVFRYRYYDQKSFNEIAELMGGATPNAARKMLCRAIARLRAELNGHGI